jgi:transposase
VSHHARWHDHIHAAGPHILEQMLQGSATAEWSLIERLIPPAKRGGNKRRVNLRKIANEIMYVLSTGCQWRTITKDLPPPIQRFGRTTKMNVKALAFLRFAMLRRLYNRS